MTVTTANTNQTGIRTFYVSSERRRGVNYAVQVVRHAGQRRLFCSCPDFLFRRVARKRHCKHARLVAALVRLFHGVRRLADAIGNQALAASPEQVRQIEESSTLRRQVREENQATQHEAEMELEAWEGDRAAWEGRYGQ